MSNKNIKRKKLIGVTPRVLKENETEKEFVNQSYIDALLQYDVNVILLTLNNPQLEDVLELCDGFLITGGSDMDPKYFGQTNDENKSKNIDSRLDKVDKTVIEYAIKNKVPMLGICRGHQTINVFLGGSLHQDIGHSHESIANGHPVKTIKNSILNFDENIIANSYHHQAVDKYGDGLKLVAYHEDGTVEALVHETLPIICIQWHPERLLETKESKIIFGKFFEYIKKYEK